MILKTNRYPQRKMLIISTKTCIYQVSYSVSSNIRTKNQFVHFSLILEFVNSLLKKRLKNINFSPILLKYCLYIYSKQEYNHKCY
jgi:hypothetical protein